MNSSIVPISDQEGNQATGFIIKHRDFFILVTAGHTFFDFDLCDFSTEGCFFLFKAERFYLDELQKLLIYKEFPGEDLIYCDYAFFILPEMNWGNLNLVSFEEEGNETFDCYGFETNGELKKVDRAGAKSLVPTFIRLRNDSGKTQNFKVINCRLKYGSGIPGYSGGPVTRKNTFDVIGMTVLGQCDEETPDKNKSQHFIISEFLIEQLDLFLKSRSV